MNRLVNIVDEYVSDKLNYLDFANLVKNVNSSLLNDIVNIQQTSKIDQRMIAIMTIYLFNYSIFDLSNDSNIYISFIKDIIEDNIIIGFETYQITNDYLIGRLKTSDKDFIIILNPSKNEINLTLPSDIANKTYYCFNCNDEIDLEVSVDMPEYSFYILKEIQKNSLINSMSFFYTIYIYIHKYMYWFPYLELSVL